MAACGMGAQLLTASWRVGGGSPCRLGDDGVQQLMQGFHATYKAFATVSAPCNCSSQGQALAAAAAAAALTPVPLVIVPGAAPPPRRSAGQPFLTLSPGEAGDEARDALPHALALPALNAAAAGLEALRGVQLYPLRLHVADLNAATRGDGAAAPPQAPAHASAPRAPNHAPLYAVYDVSGGAVYYDAAAAARTADWGALLSGGAARFSRALFRQLSAYYSGDGDAPGPHALPGQLSTYYAPAGDAPGWQAPRGLGALGEVVGAAASFAVGAALVAKLPLWFCIACPTVLGLLAPFVWNLGLTAAAQAVCTHYALPQDECDELWYGAFALAMVLSFASAVPIVFICRLPECIKKR